MQYNDTLYDVVPMPGYNIQFTYGDILKQFSHAFLDQMLVISLISLAFNAYVLYYTTGWNVPSYSDIFIERKPVSRSAIKAKILVSGAFICFLISLLYPLIIFGQLSGWYN